MTLAEMKHPVPIGATVSRETGEITIEYIDDLNAQLAFGQIMNKLNRIAEMILDEDAKRAADSCAISGNG